VCLRKSFKTLKIYNILSDREATLVNEIKAWSCEVTFNARRLTSGVYFSRMTAGSFIAVKKTVLMK
jgi:hypothetical protein